VDKYDQIENNGNKSDRGSNKKISQSKSSNHISFKNNNPKEEKEKIKSQKKNKNKLVVDDIKFTDFKKVSYNTDNSYNNSNTNFNSNIMHNNA